VFVDIGFGVVLIVGFVVVVVGFGVVLIVGFVVVVVGFGVVLIVGFVVVVVVGFGVVLVVFGFGEVISLVLSNDVLLLEVGLMDDSAVMVLVLLPFTKVNCKPVKIEKKKSKL
jgi:hypothetical protein